MGFGLLGAVLLKIVLNREHASWLEQVYGFVGFLGLSVLYARYLLNFRDVAVGDTDLKIWGCWGLARPHTIPYSMIESVRSNRFLALFGGPPVRITFRRGSPCGRRIRFIPEYSRKRWTDAVTPLEYLNQMIAADKGRQAASK
jgi:hypothetical protein